MRSQELKQELLDSSNVFTAHETEFDSRKKDHTLSQIKQDVIISENANATELKKLYTDRMLNKDNKARAYYDSIFLSAPNGKCPICSQRLVRTLDHYLPKSKYPLLSIVPYNLVPSCHDCNKDKLVDVPTKGEDETLHPYYDSVESESWLKSKIINLKPILFEFYTSPPLAWNKLLRDRISNHFSVYLLNDLYSTHALEEFENIKFQLTSLFQKGGTDLLKAHLADCYRSRFEVNKNSWQTALYECFLMDNDFINGSFI
jgi:5-methylcytosine-specific restriction endonuclease McrA